MLETVWVLWSLYEIDERAILGPLTNLFGLPNMNVEEAPAIASALTLAGSGIDFADALHVTSRLDGPRLGSFDRSLVTRAARAG
jgi:predicted nucleic-acid-binding protein